MTLYKCVRCGYGDSHKSNVKKHLTKKNLCDAVYTNTTKEDCIKILESKDPNVAIEILMKEIKIIKSTASYLTNSASIHGDHNKTTVDNSIVNNIHITVNSFDKTNYSVLKDKIHTCITDGKVDEAKLLKLLHFNKDYPENHNIKIQNKRDNAILAYNGKDFELHESGQTGVLDFLEDTLEKTGKELNKHNEVNDNDLIAVQNAPIENENLKVTQQREKARRIGKVLYNGQAIVDNTHNIKKF